jgi:hypothetical protein
VGVPERGPDQRIAHSLAPTRRWDLGVLQVEHVLRELAVEELGWTVGQVYHEAGAFGIVADGECFGTAIG